MDKIMNVAKRQLCSQGSYHYWCCIESCIRIARVIEVDQLFHGLVMRN